MIEKTSFREQGTLFGALLTDLYEAFYSLLHGIFIAKRCVYGIY